jgi:hypothetical protein
MKRAIGVTLVGVIVGAMLFPPQDVAAGIETDIPEGFADAYAAADGDAVGALYAVDAVLISDAFPVPLTGRAMIAGAEDFLFGSFCDPEWTATNVVKHSKDLAIEYTLAVDFCGPFPGPDGQLIAPTGGRISLELATFIQTDHGLITHERRYANLSGFYAQLLAP